MGGAAAFVARGTLGAHFLCALSLPADLLSPSWLRKSLEHPARQTPPPHPSGSSRNAPRSRLPRTTTFSMLTYRGGFGFRGIMRRTIGLLRSGGILPGTFEARMGGGLGMSLRFSGWGCGRGIRDRGVGRVLGAGMSCIRRISRLPMRRGRRSCTTSGLLGRRWGRGLPRRRRWTFGMRGGR